MGSDHHNIQLEGSNGVSQDNREKRKKVRQEEITKLILGGAGGRSDNAKEGRRMPNWKAQF